MKKCPFCAEEIKDEAIKCRYCGEFLKKRNKGLNYLLGCLIALGIIVILTNIFAYLAFIAFKVAMYKISSLGANLPHFYLPLNSNDAQLMLRDLSEGFRIFCGNLKG